MGLSRLLKNLRYLSRVNLKDAERETIWHTMQRMDDWYRYEVMGSEDYFRSMPYLSVLDNNQTLRLLLEKPKSFCRFGDGEFELIIGNSIPFQKYDARLADKLKGILAGSSDKYYVGINYTRFHSTRIFNEFNRRFYFNFEAKYRNLHWKFCNKERTYINAGFNQVVAAMGGGLSVR